MGARVPPGRHTPQARRSVRPVRSLVSTTPKADVRIPRETIVGLQPQVGLVTSSWGSIVDEDRVQVRVAPAVANVRGATHSALVPHTDLAEHRCGSEVARV